MLLKHFTWQHFLVAATILTAVWYAVIILVFYRKRLQDILSGEQRPAISPGPLKHSWEEDYEYLSADTDDELIGKAVLPDGMTKVSMDMFGFAPKLAADRYGHDQDQRGLIRSYLSDTDDKSRESQQGAVPDAIEDLKSIFAILERDQGGKEHFISLFALVRNKYAAIRHTPAENALNEFIRANVLFPISDEELKSLWT